ncbi:MAG TPA: hypothetical protein VG501_10020 [Rhizomicrobium sp.]|nr:hypothetical protein [Rhizomicrobium sp.]
MLLTTSAFADPVAFHPANCGFEVSFPGAAAVTQSKTQTSRGDAVVTDKASLSAELDGKPHYLRAECTHIPNMGFVDEDVLKNVMQELGGTYKLQNLAVSVEHNAVAGPVGKLRGKGKVGGKEMTIEIRRYTSKTDIFDVWIGAEPDVFPTAADAAFLQSVKLGGQDVK